LISPSPLEGEGRDEGGIIVVKHPSPFPLPQGERVHFNSDAKCIVGIFKITVLVFVTQSLLDKKGKIIFSFIPRSLRAGI